MEELAKTLKYLGLEHYSQHEVSKGKTSAMRFFFPPPEYEQARKYLILKQKRKAVYVSEEQKFDEHYKITEVAFDILKKLEKDGHLMLALKDRKVGVSEKHNAFFIDLIPLSTDGQKILDRFKDALHKAGIEEKHPVYQENSAGADLSLTGF